jgi:hypothetical protein
MGLLGPPEDKEHQREDDIDEKESQKKGRNVKRIHGLTLVRCDFAGHFSTVIEGNYFPSDIMNIRILSSLAGVFYFLMIFPVFLLTERVWRRILMKSFRT